MGRVFFVLLLWFAGSASAWAQDGMQFKAYPPDTLIEKVMGQHAWKIYATGEIDAGAGKRLEALIASNGIPDASLLFLHSPGGNLVGGIELGRAIRAHSLYTYIGQIKDAAEPSPNPGFCYSACALAFLGGTYRYLPTGSVYGVHRFFWEQHTASDADIAQIVSAVVVEYIRTMGVSTRLFALASQAGPSELVTPSHQVLLSLNVVNDGSKPTKWTIESLSGALYLKGEQETALGINKFMLTCPVRGPMYLYVLFDAGQNTNEVMTWPTNWLFFDVKRIEIQNRLTKKVVLNGRINLIYVPDHNLMETIAGTKSEIGVGLSPTSGSAIFNGFAKMPFKGAAAKLPGFLQVCGPRVADK